MKPTAIHNVIAAAVVLAFTVPVPQRPLPGALRSQEAIDARARQEREWEEIMERVREAHEAYRVGWEKIFEETRAERDAFDKVMDDYSDRFSKPAGTSVETAMSIGEDGLPESGQVMWINRRWDLVTHRAESDAEGKTDGFVQTPDGRALESLTPYAPRDSSPTACARAASTTRAWKPRIRRPPTDRNQFSDPGLEREAIEARHEVLMNRWTALAPAFETALARRRRSSPRRWWPPANPAAMSFAC